KMFKLGLLEEVRKLLDMGFKDALTSMQAIGYKELIPYIENKVSLEESKNSIIKNTKEFAKRQIRTFRNKTDFKELKVEKEELIIKHILQEIEKMDILNVEKTSTEGGI
ncbi:MAG: tRNA dimethylallyltransferase, partial [Hydrogenothermaceae bacterium]